jgi:glycosyltransferase involved in cell wall biosynthesis
MYSEVAAYAAYILYIIQVFSRSFKVHFLTKGAAAIMKQILCLSNEPWTASPGRTQQIISRLKDAQVLYFVPAAGRLDRSFRQQGRKVRPNVTVYTLPPLLLPPEERYGGLFRLGQRKLGRCVASRAARHRFRSPLLWTTHPKHVHLLDQLEYSGLIYDCDKAWEELPPNWEGCLASAADVVFSASPQLRERLEPCSSNIALLPNGVNYPLFAHETASPRPDPLPQVTGPLLGWAGTIRADLDLSPLLFAAREQPDWTFLLLGPQEDHPMLPRLSRMPNVILPGACPRAEVPDWLYRCDVLLDFLREDRPYDDVISPRIYEYLCTGKPVVSMLWPDQVEHFPDVVYGAYTEVEFLRLCHHALEEPPAFVSGRRRTHAQAAAWPNRAAEVNRILSTSGLL